jgi:acyl-CoA synthetase (NDP forming)
MTAELYTEASRAAIARMLSPQSVAIIGASDKSRWSATAFDNLANGGFKGALHLVNPRGAMAHGRQVATSCTAIGAQVDLGLIMAPPGAVLAAFDDLAVAGGRSAVILTAGFAEIGLAGQQLQDRLREAAAQRGIRLLGPNCLGFINFVNRTYVWTTPVKAPSRASGVAIVSQSGATAYFLSTLAHQQDVGLSHVVSTGNEADLDGAAFIDYFLDDPQTRAIAVFAETFRQPARLREVAERALTLGKPLVMLKVGASEATAQSALAHTGALVGDDRVFKGICQQYGIIRVQSMEELLATADIAGRTGMLRPGGLCIVTNSGGVGEIAADTAELRGINLPPLSNATAAVLQPALPETAAAHNPLDMTGTVTPEQCAQALQLLGTQEDYAAFLCPWYAVPTTPDEVSPRLTELHHHLARGLAALPVAGLLVSYTSTLVNDMARGIIAETGLNYLACGVDRALSGLSGAFWWSQRRREHLAKLEHASPQPQRLPQSAARPQSEREALEFLSRAGVPVVASRLAVTADEAVAAAREIDGAVVVKVASPDIAHKSDIGGVALNLCGDAAVHEAATRVLGAGRQHFPGARIDGVLVAPMRQGGLELFVGYTRDPQWGPVLAVGLGGVWVEVLQDVSLRPLPVDADEVKCMLGELRGARLLAGYRGIPPADIDAVADAIARIGEAVLSAGTDLEALDVNPLWVHGSKVEALDALFVWRAADSAATFPETCSLEA